MSETTKAHESSAVRGIDVPYTSLTEPALAGLIEEFVTRAGTDYGAVERTLDEKIADVRRQLARGEAKIVFDPESETVDIVVADPRTRRDAGKDA